MNKLEILASVAVLPAAIILAAAAHAAENLPPPGEYRVDREATTRSHAGPVTIELVQKVDGATGAETQVRRSSLDNKPLTTVQPGTGPAIACVRAGQAAAAAGLRCTTSAPVAVAGTASYATTCDNGLRQDDQWKRIDARTWEHRFSVAQRAASAGTLPQATVAAMKPVVNALEERIRSGPKAEADLARQQLQAMGGMTGNQAAAAPATVVVERWTRLAEACQGVR